MTRPRLAGRTGLRLLLVLGVGALLAGSLVAASAGDVRAADPKPWEHLDSIDFPPLEVAPLPGTPDPTYPELPQLWETKVPGKFMAFSTSVHSVGRTESVQSKQKLRLPDTQMVSGIQLTQTNGIDPCTSKPFPGVSQENAVIGAAIAMQGKSFDPDRPDRFGVFPPATVRSVAFGAVPVEATIQLLHLKDANGLLVPLIATAKEYKPIGPASPCHALPFSVFANLTLKGRLELRVTRLVADGHELPVGPACRARTPLNLDLTAKPYLYNPKDPLMPPHRETLAYVPSLGGYLKGAVDIPPFTGCGVGSETLDPLVTMAVSGKGTPLEMFQTTIGTGCFLGNRPGCGNGPSPFPLDSDATY